MKDFLFDSFNISPSIRVKSNLGIIERKNNNDVIIFNKLEELLTPLFFIKIRKPDLKILDDLRENEEKSKYHENFNQYDYRYFLGFFSGCHKFSFRVTFKEYKVGLKPAKFSLLLNQFNMNIDSFINLIKEILTTNFSLEFYEDLFKDYTNDLDFKIHFLVVLRRFSKLTTSTKFYIIPKGCFLIYLRKQLWYTLVMDFIFVYFFQRIYKGFLKYLPIIFLLILFYVNKIIHYKLTKIINQYEIFDAEERIVSSLGNVLAIKYISFKLFCKNNLRLLKHSYFFSARCLTVFMDDGDELLISEEQLRELDKINSYEFILSNSLNLVNSDIDLDIDFGSDFIFED